MLINKGYNSINSSYELLHYLDLLQLYLIILVQDKYYLEDITKDECLDILIENSFITKEKALDIFN